MSDGFGLLRHSLREFSSTKTLPALQRFENQAACRKRQLHTLNKRNASLAVRKDKAGEKHV